MAKLTPQEDELLERLNAMTTAEFRVWLRTPRTFDPKVNTAKVTLASKHRDTF